MSDRQKYEYRMINVSQEPGRESHGTVLPPTMASAANRWAKEGWRTVGIAPARGPGYADCILIEREVLDSG